MNWKMVQAPLTVLSRKVTCYHSNTKKVEMHSINTLAKTPFTKRFPARII